MGWEKDLPPGEELVARFRPFLEHLVVSGLSSKTVQRHVDNLWALGGEIIRDLNEDPSLRRKSMDQILDVRIERRAGRSSMPWNRKSRSSARSIPPAGSYTASSANPRVEPRKSPTDFHDEPKK